LGAVRAALRDVPREAQRGVQQEVRPGEQEARLQASQLAQTERQWRKAAVLRAASELNLW
jgi:hypothetical protein